MLGDLSLYPITNEIGFIRGPLERVAFAYAEWMKVVLPKETLVSSKVTTGVREAVLRLLPLTAPVNTRSLFVSAGKEWVAYLDNSRRGTDAAGACSQLAELAATVSIRAVACRRDYEATIFELNDSTKGTVRTVFAANDGGRWRFGQSGAPLEFEDQSSFSAKAVRNRFTPEHLDTLLQKFGIRAFDWSWYRCSETDPALLFERHLPRPAIAEFPLPPP